METKGRRRISTGLPTISQPQSCDFEGYDAISLMAETAKLRKLITKRGALEILIPLCCTTNPVRYLEFRQTLKGFSMVVAKRLPLDLRNYERLVYWKGKRLMKSHLG